MGMLPTILDCLNSEACSDIWSNCTEIPHFALFFCSFVCPLNLTWPKVKDWKREHKHTQHIHSQARFSRTYTLKSSRAYLLSLHTTCALTWYFQTNTCSSSTVTAVCLPRTFAFDGPISFAVSEAGEGRRRVPAPRCDERLRLRRLWRYRPLMSVFFTI